jgi:hypothetical protein
VYADGSVTYTCTVGRTCVDSHARAHSFPEEWRLSADSKRVDLTFIEASATSDARLPLFLPLS